MPFKEKGCSFNSNTCETVESFYFSKTRERTEHWRRCGESQEAGSSSGSEHGRSLYVAPVYILVVEGTHITIICWREYKKYV